MNWIFIGMILGSTVTSSHDTQEACEGRKVILEKKEIKGDCIQYPKQPSSVSINSNGITWGTVSPNNLIIQNR